MPLIARQRSRLAALAVLALVGSLLAVSAAPAVAAGDKEPTYPATYSACVGAAEEDAGLTDMDGHTFEAAANCLAHYNITKGTSEGVFSPNASINRLQMALFLARAAGPAGIELLDPAVDQGFGDIDGYTSEIQDAINAIAEVGIMDGTSDDAFSPDGLVSRADMAVFLDAFVEASPIGPGGLANKVSKYEDVEPDDEPFDDVGSVSFGAYGSIRRVYELGIAKGTGDGTMFSPSALVTRGQMAAFITRALAHTNARPAGVSIQSDMDETDNSATGGFTLQISVRDDGHAPMVDAVVDHFSASSADVAFDDDGLCNAIAEGQAADPAGSSTRCEIDAGDEATDSDGNLEADIDADDYCPGNTKWIWAWTGDIGDKFDADDTDAASIGVGVTKAKASIKTSHDAAASTVEFGTTVTVTLQLVDKEGGKGDPVSEAEVEISLDTSEVSGNNTRSSSQTHETDDSGKVELTFSFNDPDEDADSDEVTVTVTLTDDATAADLRPDDDPDTTGDDEDESQPVVAMITWSDNDSKATSLSLSQSVNYHVASDAGGGVRHTVTATLTDQYGDPMPGVTVHFWSNAIVGDRGSVGGTTEEDDLFRENDGLGGAKGTATVGGVEIGTWTDSDDDGEVDDNEVAYAGTSNFGGTDKTNRSGVARKSYNRDTDVAMTEIIGAIAVIGNRDGIRDKDTNDDGDIDTDDDRSNMEFDDIRGDADPDTDGNQDMRHYWAVEAGDGALAVSPARAVDTDANTVVVAVGGAADADDGTNTLAKYDSNDQFNAGLSGDTGGIKIDVFEENLEVGNELLIDMAADPEPGVNSFSNNTLGLPGAVICHD